MGIGINSVLNLNTAGLALSQIPKAIQGLYRMGVNFNEYIDDHIAQMKKSDNQTIAQTGRVIEAAKFGFGIGYMSSVVIIAVGQLLLGNTLSAVATVVTAATLTNPLAMTCAAVGAIYYGWSALSSGEKDEILEKLRTGLQIGVETVKAILAFLVKATKKLLSSENIAELKSFTKECAASFGKSLSDVTRNVMDRLKDAAEKTANRQFDMYRQMLDVASDATQMASDSASSHFGWSNPTNPKASVSSVPEGLPEANKVSPV